MARHSLYPPLSSPSEAGLTASLPEALSDISELSARRLRRSKNQVFYDIIQQFHLRIVRHIGDLAYVLPRSSPRRTTSPRRHSGDGGSLSPGRRASQNHGNQRQVPDSPASAPCHSV